QGLRRQHDGSVRRHGRACPRRRDVDLAGRAPADVRGAPAGNGRIGVRVPRLRRTTLLASAGVLLLAAPALGQTDAKADLVLVNGTILTMDAADHVARALAIRHGQIVAVGTTDQVLGFRGPGTRVVDLHGRTATPGLIDTHGHFADGGASQLFRLDLSDAASVKEIVRRVAAAVATRRPGEWVLGEGWDDG